MKTYFIFALLLLTTFSCKKEHDVPLVPPSPLPGGKGGIFNIAIFPLKGSQGIPGKVFIKYGAQSIPGDYGEYSDSSATMTEPGFGPHAHFFSLKAGFYALAAYGLDGSLIVKGDTLIEITETQAKSVDYNLQLK